MNTNRHLARVALLLGALFSGLATFSLAHGGISYTWWRNQGSSGGDWNWTTAGNWNHSGHPGTAAADTAIFADATPGTVVTAGLTTCIASMTFNNTSGNNYTIGESVASGGAITLGSIVQDTVATGLNTINASVTFTGDAAYNIRAGTIIQAGMVVGANLSKQGDGTLVLSNSSNNFGLSPDGMLLIGANMAVGGTVRMGAAGVLPPGRIIIYGGTLDLGGQDYTTTKSSWTLNLGGDQDGGLGAGPAGSSANIDTNGGTLTLGNGVSYVATNNPNGATISGKLSLGTKPQIFDVGDSSAAADDLTTNAMILATSGSMVKRGPGTLRLNSPNASTGNLTIGTTSSYYMGGTVRVGDPGALPHGATSAIRIYSGTLDLNGHSCDTKQLLTLGGGPAHSTSNITTGAGVLTLGSDVSYDATNNPDGATISGTLSLGTKTRVFDVGDSSAATTDLTISARIFGDSSVGLIKAGPGTLVLTNNNTYTGITAVTGGTLLVSDANVLPPGGGLSIGAGATVVLAGNLSRDVQSAGTAIPTGTSDVTALSFELRGSNGQAPTIVPEPCTLVLLLAGAAMSVWRARAARRRTMPTLRGPAVSRARTRS